MKEERFSKEVVMPQKPRHTAPPAACDCHGHIFPSRDAYPTANETMPLSPIETYVEVHKLIGIQRGVLVQGGAYRHDNRAMLDALDRFPTLLRGVALVTPDISLQELESMQTRGVRALRFTNGGASRLSDMAALAPKMRDLGFHAELFVGTKVLQERAAELLALKIPLVFDHLGGPYGDAAGRDDAGFQFLLKTLANEDVWLKLSPQRNSKLFPSYTDARPYYDAIVAVRPDRLVWGSDWPFPNMGHNTPDPGVLLDIFFDWTPDENLRRRILVDNAARLYGFPAAA